MKKTSTLRLHRETLIQLEEPKLKKTGGAYTGHPCYPFSYPRSMCPGDTCI